MKCVLCQRPVALYYNTHTHKRTHIQHTPTVVHIYLTSESFQIDCTHSAYFCLDLFLGCWPTTPHWVCSEIPFCSHKLNIIDYNSPLLLCCSVCSSLLPGQTLFFADCLVILAENEDISSRPACAMCAGSLVLCQSCRFKAQLARQVACQSHEYRWRYDKERDPGFSEQKSQRNCQKKQPPPPPSQILAISL